MCLESDDDERWQVLTLKDGSGNEALEKRVYSKALTGLQAHMGVWPA